MKKEKVESTVSGKAVKLVMVIIIFLMFEGWAFLVLHDQNSGNIFRKVYPKCKAYRTQLCFDNGHCDIELNNKECNWDGDNCGCCVADIFRKGDEHCDGGDYNSKQCNYDGGDCNEFNANYPGCNVDDPSRIGDGNCNGGNYKPTAAMSKIHIGLVMASMMVATTILKNAIGMMPTAAMPKIHIGSVMASAMVATTTLKNAIFNYDGGDCNEFNATYPDYSGLVPSELCISDWSQEQE